MPAQQKPEGCAGCDLHTVGQGFVPPSGPAGARILFVGESPGASEIQAGIGFVGAAGGKLNHILYRIGRERANARVANLIQCRPPQDKLEGWLGPILHCSRYLDPVLAERRPVIVALGAEPARILTGAPNANIKDLHGTVIEREFGGRKVWVVSSFHPSHLVRGAHNLTGTMAFDLTRAYEIADSGKWEPDTPTLHCDPSPEFFQNYVNEYLHLLEQDPWHTFLAIDIETPDKEREQDEGELKSVDRSMIITRMNFSYSSEVGLTVPAVEPYMTIARPLIESKGTKWFWNKPYDLKRLKQRYKVHLGTCLDGMDAWKMLHSDTPRGLGFVSPFASTAGAWKHLSGSNPSYYAAMDGVQTIRCAYMLVEELTRAGQWEAFYRHHHEFGVYATTPSCDVGLKIDRKQLEGYTTESGVEVPGMRADLRRESEALAGKMQELVPDELKPLLPSKDGWVKRPDGYVGEDGIPKPILEIPKKCAVKVCRTCGAQQVAAKHRCKDPETGKPSKTLAPAVENVIIEVPRFFVRGDFNPGSWQQVLAYIKSCGHKPGIQRGKETTNRDTIERLADAAPKSRKDHRARDLYHHLLDYRDIKKVLGTYVEGTLRRLEADRAAGITDDRLHPTVTNNPSTQRTAMADPNLQNVVADRRGAKSLSAGYRRAVVAAPGCDLVELDWSSIEAVNTGWMIGDPDYIKMAWTGVHDHVVAYVCGKPISMQQKVDQIMAQLAAIKDQEDVPGGKRDPVKRVVHGTNYGLTPYGMAKRFRKLFASAGVADVLQQAYFKFAPKLPEWQKTIQELAYKQEFLGGAGAHPFAYRHEFYNVRDYVRITEAQARQFQRLAKEGKPSASIVFMNGTWYQIKPGEDAKRAMAFFPQSIAAGTIRETALLLFKPGEALAQGYPDWYIGDRFYGKTPLRAIIHDSFLLELPKEIRDETIKLVAACMTRPIKQLPLPAEWGLGEYLQFGVGVKVGENWAEMKKVKVDQPWLRVLRAAQGEDADQILAAQVGIFEDAVVDEELEGEDEWSVEGAA